MRLKPKEKGDQYYTLTSFYSFNPKTLPKKGLIATFYYNYGLSRQVRPAFLGILYIGVFNFRYTVFLR